MEILVDETLKRLGLTEGETKVYKALLEHKNSTVGPLIKTAKVSNSKIYTILNSLIDKGIATFVSVEKTKYFQPAPPHALIELLDRQIDDLEKTKQQTQHVVETIRKTIEEQKSKEEARIYKGYRGVSTGLFESFATIPDNGVYYFFSIGYGENPRMTRLFRRTVGDMVKRGIEVRGIAHRREKHMYETKYKSVGYNMRYTTMQWPADTNIAGDYLTFLVFDGSEPTLYSIHSKILTQSYLIFFNNLWDQAKK